jgi:hypothetical protein
MNKQKIMAVATPLIPLIIGAVAGYFGFEPIQEKINPAPVDVDVHVPEQAPHSHPHSHPQKDWQPVIDKAIDDLLEEYH